MTQIVLGPLLRYVGETEATIWFETDAPTVVRVDAGEASASAHTFEVHGHFYALVILRGLAPGDAVPYTVALDDEPAWPPPAYPFPPPVLRTLGEERELRISFGSCRVALPNEAPFTSSADDEPWGFRHDALHALALRMIRGGLEEWPRLMFFCGDQVYADELSPRMRAEIDRRRQAGIRGPDDEAAHFEEYTLLYADAWADPVLRWFLSVVPSAMIFDDHDVEDDWNTSWAWMKERRKLEWWEAKMAAALSSYWIYQHMGNLPPGELEGNELWASVAAAQAGEETGDLWPLFERFGVDADRDNTSVRWSFVRDLGGTRLVVMDSRGARQLDPEDRRMIDPEEWRWIEEQTQGDFEHLLLGTSIPWLLHPAIHDTQRWNEAVSEGAWGRAAGRAGEWMRQAVDLEHWPAFGTSFLELAELTRSVATGERGAPPASVVVLSGDVHHAYLAEARWPDEAGLKAPVWQATCSPVRNPLAASERRGQELLRSRPLRRLAYWLAERAGAYQAPFAWDEVAGPSFDNQIATLDIHGSSLRVRIEKAVGHPAEPPRLEAWVDRRLDRPAQREVAARVAGDGAAGDFAPASPRDAVLP